VADTDVNVRKPTYLGLLNAIALAETRAHEYLNAWAGVTSDPDVRGVIRSIAIREGEHGFAFIKRLNELGFDVLDRPDPEHERRLEVARSATLSDMGKFEALRFDREPDPDRPDVFDGFFRDHSIDIATGTLLGRYIAEERDTGRRFRSCYQALAAKARL
jgi:hypothetical protein